MYRCQDCDYQFLYADSLVDRHNLENPPFEKIAVCPNCKGRNFSEIKRKELSAFLDNVSLQEVRKSSADIQRLFDQMLEKARSFLM